MRHRVPNLHQTTIHHVFTITLRKSSFEENIKWQLQKGFKKLLGKRVHVLDCIYESQLLQVSKCFPRKQRHTEH